MYIYIYIQVLHIIRKSKNLVESRKTGGLKHSVFCHPFLETRVVFPRPESSGSWETRKRNSYHSTTRALACAAPRRCGWPSLVWLTSTRTDVAYAVPVIVFVHSGLGGWVQSNQRERETSNISYFGDTILADVISPPSTFAQQLFLDSILLVIMGPILGT